MDNAWRQWPLNVVRGGLIGTVETIPGVSGGTVALVVGVYHTLIDAAGHVVSALKAAVLGRFPEAKAELAQAKWRTILPLLVGMAVFLIISARFLSPILAHYPQHARALFFGMILVAVAIPVRSMHQSPRRRDLGLIAATTVLTAIFLIGFRTEMTDPPLWFVPVAAAVAINALVLPGLSGAFLLLMMGMYEPTLQALNDRDFAYIGLFMLGMALGLGSFVKVLQWLLNHRKQATLAVMAGLMAGSLTILWPWQDEATSAPAAPGDGALLYAALAALGALAVATMIVVEAQVAARSRHRHDDDSHTPDAPERLPHG